MTRFTFKANSAKFAKVDICLATIVQSEAATRKLANENLRIDSAELAYTRIDLPGAETLTYNKVVFGACALFTALSDCFFVLYNREATLDSLSLALPSD